MTPEEWQRIRPILESALELEPAKRAGFLDGACQDAVLRHEVESLIASHDEGGPNLLETPPAPNVILEQELQLRLRAGTRVGAYQIIKEVAQGGMGAVYQAVRADGQYKQRVALKIVRSEFGGEFTAARFRNERQILASLDHPNIAKILDGGTTAEGVPFFVMEFIDGLPITEYCDQQKLTVDARLNLFRTVCSAVHYAHQHLVVHRDIKPSNILVTAEGVPKLLDFGIAKLLNPNLLPEHLTFTAGGFAVMTPEYASPEQLSGAPITTATDVYSLGLVLYELLAGRRPFRFPNAMPHEVAKVVLESDPEKPSAATSREEKEDETVTASAGPRNAMPITPQQISSLRGELPDKLRRRLSGDLDNIVLKALRKEISGRYSSADQLSDDIRRHLEGLPVLARKGSVVYHCRKYVQRHKVVVASAAIVFASLVTGLFLTLREARIARANELRAEKRFNDVRALANSLLFEVHDSIRNLAGATPARKLLVSKALQYLDSLSTEAAGDASLQRELAAAYERVGDVQGYPDTANLGDFNGALASYHKALAIRESLATAGNSTEVQEMVAGDYERIGRTLEAQGKYGEALEFSRKHFLIRKALAEADPSLKSKELLAGAYFVMAACYSQLGDTSKALENYRESAAIREALAPQSQNVQARLAGTYGYMAPILWRTGDRAQAILVQQKALDIVKGLSDADPTNASYREYLDEAYYWKGFYQAEGGNFSQALVNYRRALEDYQKLSAADPKEARTREYIGDCHKSIGKALVGQGDLRKALDSLRKALSAYEELPYRDVQDLAETYDAMGLAYARLASRPGISGTARLANWTQARDAYQKSLASLLVFKKSGADVDRLKRELAKCDAAIQKAKKSEM